MKKDKDEWIIEGILRKNSITMMDIAHDNCCQFMKDRTKECNCNQEITFKEIG